MAIFVFIYHGGDHPESEAEGARMMQEWETWLADLGDAVIDPGKPMAISKTVMSDGSVVDNGGSNPASGYSLHAAEDMDAALKMAQSCPFLKINGTIEVAESFDM